MSLAGRLTERFRSSEPPALEFISRRCLRNRLQGNACTRCLDECQVQAISGQEPGGVRLDPKRCAGCLACTAVCPAEALVGKDYRLAASPGKAAGRETLVFCCEKSIRSGEEIVLPCLGALAEEQLAAFAAQAAKGVRLSLVKCSDCRAAFVPDLLARRLAALNSRLGNGEITGSIRLLLQEEGNGEPAESSSRRAFFKAFREISFHAATETMATLQADPDQREQHAHKHQPARLAQLRQAIIDTGDQGTRQALLRFFFSLTVSDECNFCGGCAGMCPTGALKNIREEEGKQLQFDWARCSGCGLCLEFCREKAICLTPGRNPESLGTEIEVLLQGVPEIRG
ncbi:MAG: 4Fe-4S binding protein [Pseudomonadota bacterium]